MKLHFSNVFIFFGICILLSNSSFLIKNTKTCQADSYQEYFSLVEKDRGLIQIGSKLPIPDNVILSQVYTPGVAAPCLEISKNQNEAYKYTSKQNSVLLITDDSGREFKKGEEGKWNEKGLFPYLDGMSALYKKLGNINVYPLILKKEKIKSGADLYKIIKKISIGYSGVEFFSFDTKLIEEYKSEKLKNDIESSYVELISSINDYKNDNFNIIINSAAFRLALDTKTYININQLCIFLKNNMTKIDILNKNTFDLIKSLVSTGFDYLSSNKLVNHKLLSHDLTPVLVNKEYILNKYISYLNHGEKSWINNFPHDYFPLHNSNDSNSLILHHRHKGKVQIQLNSSFYSIDYMTHLLTFSNFEKLSLDIIRNPVLARTHTYHGNTGAIISNGSAVLGLGNIGALAGLPVMEGKSLLFKNLGGTNIIPLVIDEKNKDEIIRLLDILSPSFSIINLEDIKSPECFYIENEFNKLVDYPVFHDDQSGTAVVVLAGLINSLKLAEKKISDVKILINGAGAAGLTVANLLISYGAKKIIMFDTSGAIYKGRTENMNYFKELIAEKTNLNLEKGQLIDLVKDSDVLIGLSSSKAFTKEMIIKMSSKSIVFALANPEPEIFPEEAKKAGAFIVATGRSDFPNQINNSLVFPGLFRGAIDTGVENITTSMKIGAALAVAGLIKDEMLSEENIIPNAIDLRIPIENAKAVALVAEKEGLIRVEGISSSVVERNIESYLRDGRFRYK